MQLVTAQDPVAGIFVGEISLSGAHTGVYTDVLRLTPTPGPTPTSWLGSFQMAVHLHEDGSQLSGFVESGRSLTFDMRETILVTPAGAETGDGTPTATPSSLDIGPRVTGAFDGSTLLVVSAPVTQAVSAERKVGEELVPAQIARRQFVIQTSGEAGNGDRLTGTYAETIWGMGPVPSTVYGNIVLSRQGVLSPPTEAPPAPATTLAPTSGTTATSPAGTTSATPPADSSTATPTSDATNARPSATIALPTASATTSALPTSDGTATVPLTPRTPSTPSSGATTPAPPVATTQQSPPTASATMVAPPSATSTSLPPSAGLISGIVQVQGRSDFSGVAVDAALARATTDSRGRYSLPLAAGTHDILFTHARYLPSRISGIRLDAREQLTAPDVFLHGGDTDDNGEVNLFDLVRVGANYDMNPPDDLRADVNGDGVVNLFDLVMVGSNYRTGGIQEVPLPSVANSRWSSWWRWLVGPPSTTPAPDRTTLTSSISIEAPTMVASGETFTVDVVAEPWTDILAADVRVSFDPEALEPIDAYPSVTGIQALPGPGFKDAYVAENRILSDGARRIRHFAATRLKVISHAAPSNPEGISDRTLMRLTFRARVSGTPEVRLLSVELANVNGAPMQATLTPFVPGRDR